MSIFKRLAAIFQSGANHVTGELEDPKLSLDYSLVKLEESRDQVNRSLVEISTSRRQLENHNEQLRTALDKYQEQAQLAVSMGRDDLARKALERKQEVQSRLAELEQNMESLDRQLDSLKLSQASLERKIALFRSKKEELKAVYDASRAQMRLKEKLYGISNDLNDIGRTIQRAEGRIQEMRARAEAIDGLVEQGILIDVLEPNKDDVDRELDRMNRAQLVDQELARLKNPVIIENPEKDLPPGEQQNSLPEKTE